MDAAGTKKHTTSLHHNHKFGDHPLMRIEFHDFVIHSYEHFVLCIFDAAVVITANAAQVRGQNRCAYIDHSCRFERNFESRILWDDFLTSNVVAGCLHCGAGSGGEGYITVIPAPQTEGLFENKQAFDLQECPIQATKYLLITIEQDKKVGWSRCKVFGASVRGYVCLCSYVNTEYVTFAGWHTSDNIYRIHVKQFNNKSFNHALNVLYKVSSHGYCPWCSGHVLNREPSSRWAKPSVDKGPGNGTNMQSYWKQERTAVSIQACSIHWTWVHS